MAVPTRTPQQRRDASARAVAARQRRAQVAAQLKSGEVTLPALLTLADDEPAIAAMHVRVVLESLPRMGPGGAVTR